MTNNFANVYGDAERAAAYAKLEFPGTYYLAYRDLPEIISGCAKGGRGLDFGCGSGRSTRFLRGLGFEVTGVDISARMLDQARELDPDGDYRLVPDDGTLTALDVAPSDVILSAFTFDNIPTREKKVGLFRSLRQVLKPGGHIVSLVSSPEIYTHEWASFSTRDFPENRQAASGEKVLIVMLDVEDARPVEDILWSAAAYHDVYREAGLQVVDTFQPLAKPEEPFDWVSETTVAPWTIYVLAAAD